MFPLTVFNAIVESKGEQIIDPTTKVNKLAIGSALKWGQQDFVSKVRKSRKSGGAGFLTHSLIILQHSSY